MFTVWSRVHPLGHNRFLCIVAAFPEPPSEAPSGTDAETTVATTREQADRYCEQVMSAMAARIWARGDAVIFEVAKDQDSAER